MKRLTIGEALTVALRAEQLGAEFYRALAKKYEHKPAVRNVIEMLAKDEDQHYKQFAEIIMQTQKWELEIADNEKELLAALDISVHFADFDSVHELTSPIEILKRAYNFEKNAMLYFMTIRDILGKNDALESIIKMEREHTVILMQYIIEDGNLAGALD